MLESLGAHVLKKLIDQHWPWSKKPSPEQCDTGIYEQVHRFKRVMLAHELKPAYWPEFFEICKAPFAIKHADLKNDDTLLEWLDEDKLDWICETFLIRRDWINGYDCRPHISFSFNKDQVEMVDAIKAESNKFSLNNYGSKHAFIFISSTSKNALEYAPHVLMAYSLPVCQLRDEVLVSRWILDLSAYPWGQSFYQRQVLQFANIAYHEFTMDPRWAQLTQKDFDKLETGDLLIPEALAISTRNIRKEPYDYFSDELPQTS